MFRGQPIIENDCQIAGFGELQPKLSKRRRAAKRPTAAMQIDNHRMRTRPARHRDISAESRTQVHVFFESSDCRKILVVSDRQLFPGAALRSDIAGGVPTRQAPQNLTVVLAHHTQSVPVLAKRTGRM